MFSNQTPINNKTIHKTAKVQCDRDTMWWKWTTHDGLKTFFGPDNKIEFKVGGAFEIYFMLENPEGLRGGEGNIVLSYLPKEMLSFTWNAPPEHSEIREHPHKTWVIVNFDEIDNETTEVNLYHMGWLDGEKWDAVHVYFENAWETVLNWLDESCTK